MPDQNKQHWSTVLLIMLLAADLAFILIGFGYDLGYYENDNLSFHTDRGYAEFFQYTKFLWIGIALLILTVLKRQMIYGVGSALFFYLMLDDSLEIHEHGAGMIVKALGKYHGSTPFLGLRNQDLGEMLVSGAVGGLVLVLGFLAYRYGNKMSRRVGIHLLIGMLALAFAGVFIDMLAIMVEEYSFWLDQLMVVLEDGGEMVVVSAITWYCHSLLSQEWPRARIRAMVDSDTAE